MNPFLAHSLQTEPLSHTSQTSRAPCFISVRQAGDKQASVLANVVSAIMPERTANQGIRLSSYWKAPKISTVLTSPSGNRISLLLQGTESSHPHVLPAPSALSPCGNWIPIPHKHTQSRCLHPADSLTPGLSRKCWEGQSNVSFHIIPPQLESVSSYSPWDPNGAILCSEFYF